MLKGGGGEESELGKRGGKTPRSAYKKAKGFCLAGPADQRGARSDTTSHAPGTHPRRTEGKPGPHGLATRYTLPKPDRYRPTPGR